jgi:hypothetical protein
MKNIGYDFSKTINLNQESNACVKHLLKYWDLSSISFVNPEKTGDAPTEFILECFTLGTYLGEHYFYLNKPFQNASDMKFNRRSYLTDLLCWNHEHIEKDSLYSFLDGLSKMEYMYSNIQDKETKIHRNDYPKTVENLYNKLSKTFKGIKEAKPFGYKDYISKHFDKELIYAYEDQIQENMDDFEGHFFAPSSNCFASRIAISKTGYYDVEQGDPPYFSLIGALYVQGRFSIEYINSSELLLDLNKINLNSDLSFKNINNAEQDSWFDFFYESIETTKPTEQDLKLVANKKYNEFYTFDQYMTSLNEDNVDPTSRKIRLLIKKKKRIEYESLNEETKSIIKDFDL